MTRCFFLPSASKVSSWYHLWRYKMLYHVVQTPLKSLWVRSRLILCYPARLIACLVRGVKFSRIVPADFWVNRLFGNANKPGSRGRLLVILSTTCVRENADHGVQPFTLRDIVGVISSKSWSCLGFSVQLTHDFDFAPLYFFFLRRKRRDTVAFRDTRRQLVFLLLGVFRMTWKKSVECHLISAPVSITARRVVWHSFSQRSGRCHPLALFWIMKFLTSEQLQGFEDYKVS